MSGKTILETAIAAILTLCFQTAFSQIDPTELSGKLSRCKEKLGKDVAFILFKDGKVAYKKEIGKLNVKTPIPIGASSQWLTAALVMTFVQEG